MGRHVMAFSLAGAALLVAGPVLAQHPVPSAGAGAIQLGLRFGYGVPFGKTGRTATDGTDDDLSRSIKGQVPIGIDAGYLITPNIYVGLLFQYGFGLIGSDGEALCNQTGVNCSTSDLTLGVNGHYHVNPTAPVDPWIGLGFNYEAFNLSADFMGRSSSATGSGFQYVNIQVGADISVAPNLAVGPIVSFAAGQYLNVSQQTGTTTISQDITNKSFHEWLLFGVRGVYNVQLH